MKKITALITVLLMLAASSAFAAVTETKTGLPVFLNGTLDKTLHPSPTVSGAGADGTYLTMSGFGVNATNKVYKASDDEKGLGYLSVFASNNTGLTDRSDYFLINGTSANFNGSIYALNGSDLGRFHYANGTDLTTPTPVESAFDFAATFGGIENLTQYSVNNATFNATTVYVPAGNYQMMVGLVNGTLLNATYEMTDPSSVPHKNINAETGVSLQMLYANGTFEEIANTHDVWDYYSFGQSKALPVFTVAQVKINAADGKSNAQVKYFVSNGTKVNKTTDGWIAYNATNLGHNSLTLAASHYKTLFDNATINQDKNMITGYVNTAANGRCFAVMIKNGSVLSRSDLTNRGFKTIFVGSKTDDELGNATAGISSMVFDKDLVITQGHNAQLDTRATGVAGDAFTKTETDLGNYFGALTTTNEFGLSQSNMTVYIKDGKTVASSFIGKQSADKLFSVGIYEAPEATAKSDTAQAKGLMFLIPDSAVTYEIKAAGNGFQHNASLLDTDNYNVRLVENATGYTSTALKANWKGVASNFTPLTEVKGYALTVEPKSKKDSVYFTAQFGFSGVGGLINNLRLYKVSDAGSSSWSLHYSSEASPSVDGAWWISNAENGGYLNENSVLDPSIKYYLNWTIKDNGNYDSNKTVCGIVDPVVLGSVPTSSSSSSSGCVFNPTAGFSLEWLLLMLAPMVAIVRSRFKK